MTRIGWGGLLLLAGCTAIFDLHSAPNQDHDNDGVIDREDNCPDAFNRDQSDKDGDGAGDACDECLAGPDSGDIDGDGIPDDCDECDNTDADDDGDGIPNNCDDCANNGADKDGDGIDDGCDTCIEEGRDSDHDGIDDGCDSCFNTGIDSDEDGIDDACDICQGPQHDEDGDGFLDSCGKGTNSTGPMSFDNCPAIANADQFDGPSLNSDGVGDACDGDPVQDTQYFDGFVAQNPAWIVNGAGWLIANDDAHLLIGSGSSYRALPRVHGHMRIRASVYVAAGTSGAQNGAEVFVVNGDSKPPGIDSARCRISPNGQVVVVVYTGGTEKVDTAAFILPGFPGSSVVLSLDVTANGKTVTCSADKGLSGAQIISSGALPVTDFFAGIGGQYVNADFRYFDAIWSAL